MNRLLAVVIAAMVVLCTALVILTAWAIHVADSRAEEDRAIVVERLTIIQRENRQLSQAVAEYLVCVYEMQYGSDPGPVDHCGELLEEVLQP